MTAPAVHIGWRRVFDIAWRTIVFAVAVGILVVVVTRWNRWEGAPGWQGTDDAYVEAYITPITTKVSGYVTQVPVQDFQRVRAGQLIAQVYDGDYRATVAQAQASVASYTAQARVLAAQSRLQSANVEAARAVIASTVAQLDQNGRDLARQNKLLATGSSSEEAGEKLRTTHDQLVAQLAENDAQAQAAIRQLGVIAAQEQQTLATIDAAKAAARLAQINLDYTRVIAPRDGVLAQRQVMPGQYVGVGAQITSLTPLPHVWVIANYKETQLTHMSVGNRAEIRVDAYPGRVLKGHVIAFAPGSGAVFALLPPDNATGNFTKVVQRVAVKIVIDDDAGLGERLRPGLSVTPRVDARDRPGR
jgi:membrane fusion protein (multidrug efflux system)